MQFLLFHIFFLQVSVLRIGHREQDLRVIGFWDQSAQLLDAVVDVEPPPSLN